MRLNLGSGQHAMPREAGWVNCDIAPEANPDVLMDLTQAPWPFESDSIEEIRANHVFEHLGNGYKTVWQEMYRVLKPGGRVYIAVPHPRHEHFLGDPTHVRPIHQMQFTLLSKRNCNRWKEEGAANSPLALYWDVDFEVEGSVQLVPDPRWTVLRPQSHQHTIQQLAVDSELFNGVCAEIRCQLVKVAP